MANRGEWQTEKNGNQRRKANRYEERQTDPVCVCVCVREREREREREGEKEREKEKERQTHAIFKCTKGLRM
jgi:hypothetical protein